MKTLPAAASVLAVSLIVGCSDSQPPAPAPAPGPAEQAGRQIDQAMETAGEKTRAALETARSYTNEKIDEAGKALEHAGEKLQE